jgi:hypothetical protein
LNTEKNIRIRRGGGRRRVFVVRDATFTMEGGEGERKLTAVKVPRQCPVFLLVKIGWRQCRAFGSEESDVTSGLFMFECAFGGKKLIIGLNVELC